MDHVRVGHVLKGKYGKNGYEAVGKGRPLAHAIKQKLQMNRVLGVTLFCPHARTSHLTTFARTHFARTRAFCPVALRTRTRTSKFST